MRAGFTLPEVLVAILVLTTGILGLAASGTFLVRQTREARTLVDAAILAGSVLDSLRSIPCSAVGNGAAVHGPVSLRWVTSSRGPAIGVVTTIAIAGRRIPWQLTIDTLLPCDRPA